MACFLFSKCSRICQFVFFQKIHFSESALDRHFLSLGMDPPIVEGAPSVN